MPRAEGVRGMSVAVLRRADSVVFVHGAVLNAADADPDGEVALLPLHEYRALAALRDPFVPADAGGEIEDLPALTPLANLIRRCAHDALRSRGVEDAERLGLSIAVRVGMEGALLDAARETLADAEGPALTPPAGEVGELLAWLVIGEQWPRAYGRDGANYGHGVPPVWRPPHAAATVLALAAQAREAEGLRAQVAIVRDRLAHSDAENGRRCEELRTALREAATLRARVVELEGVLREYAGHRYGCHANAGLDCTCGYDRARAAETGGGE